MNKENQEKQSKNQSQQRASSIKKSKEKKRVVKADICSKAEGHTLDLSKGPLRALKGLGHEHAVALAVEGERRAGRGALGRAGLPRARESTMPRRVS